MLENVGLELIGFLSGNGNTGGAHVTEILQEIQDAGSAQLERIGAAMENLAPEFSASTAYSAGDYVLYNGKMYRFTAAHAAGAWSGRDATEVTTAGEISGLKDDLSDINTATPSDVGKALKAKTVTNGKVTEWEFGEAGGGADPATIEQAVEDWLDDHPDATTTVEDGSLTEAKFTAAALALLKNNYVTPEMFGAKGDGVADDAAAINAMFASNNNVFVFGNKTYLTNAAVTCNKSCSIFFDHTTISAKKSYGLRDFEYVIGFTAGHIETFGKLTVMANTSVNIGIWLATIGGSHFDSLKAQNARIWGVYIDETTDSNNGLSIKNLSSVQNGFKAHATAKRIDSKHLEISNITGAFTGYSDDIRAGLFDNRYYHANLIIDDSGYEGTARRFAFYHSGGDPGFELDSEDISKATFYVNSSGPGVPTDYTQNDTPRDVLILIGGGVKLGSLHSEGVYHIENLSTQTNPLSSYITFGYGGRIGSYSSEFDTVVMNISSMVTHIGYTYFEGVGNGYNYLFGDNRDRIYLFTQTKGKRIFIENPFIGQSRIPFETGNVVINYRQASTEFELFDEVFGCPNYLASTRLVGLNGVSNGNNGIITNAIDENFPRDITMDCYGLTGTTKIKLDLHNLQITNQTNSFSPVNFYIRRRRTNSDYDDFQIGLSNALISAGYSIHGAINNTLTIHPSEYGNFVKVTVVLFRSDKTFFVTASPLTFVDNTAE